MNGILLVDKPLGKTSHDMVYFVRRLTGIKKVGHTGTLDPDATGVLPVCIGKATKVCDMLTSSDKRYIASLTLGKTTDTQDASGNVLTECEVDVSERQIIEIVNEFIGEIEQIPPMFSAIKKDGKKLYELARQGITVEREARKIKIHSIDIVNVDIENHTVEIDVHCSKGTYIRTLCEDIGKRLGCGAYMNSLRRTESGGFSISDCHTVEELSRFKEDSELIQHIIPVEKVFEEYNEVVLNEHLSSLLKNGVKIRKTGLVTDKLYRVYDSSRNFLAVSKYNGAELVLEKAFWS
ncbi:MAG: tRNA pseudouridine(55) synthase TruB [Eubacteriales bacterium]|nr:tRNA pseudouridine(55) synthase TruB [Eubacteriales bacterium]